MAIYKPRTETSEEANPADTTISDFWLQHYEEIDFCFLNCPFCDMWCGT